jgi:hypothetical protein
VLAPDLQRETQEGQIERQFLLIVCALVTEVPSGFGRAGQRGGAVLYHIVLLLPLVLLASQPLVFPFALAFVSVCHIWIDIQSRRGNLETVAGPTRPRACELDTIGECYGSGRCAVKDANVGSVCAQTVIGASVTAVGSVRRARAGGVCGPQEPGTRAARTVACATRNVNAAIGSGCAKRPR